jgi:hypothetical protein
MASEVPCLYIPPRFGEMGEGIALVRNKGVEPVLRQQQEGDEGPLGNDGKPYFIRGDGELQAHPISQAAK